MKRTFVLAFLCLPLIVPGCVSSQATRAPSSHAADNRGDHKERVRRLYLDGYIGGDLAAIDAVFAPEYLRHDSGSSAIADLQAQYDLVRDLRRAFPDLQGSVDFVIADGNMVAARWTLWGTATGPSSWAPPSGKPFRFSGINVYRFDNGKAVELWNHRDDLAWFQQLGVVTLPARPPD